MDATIVDVDGTLCDVSTIRHLVNGNKKDFHDFHTRAYDCPPNRDVLNQVTRHYLSGREILVVTARTYKYEQSTLEWLNLYMPVPYHGPYMRGERDFRPDREVKRDIHQMLTEDGYRIVHCIDDNPSIVALWLQLGIPTTEIHQKLC